MKFLLVPDGATVSMHTFRKLFHSHENSWGTMATSQTPGAFAAKETSLLTSSPFLQRQTLPRGNMKCA